MTKCLFKFLWLVAKLKLESMFSTKYTFLTELKTFL